MGSVQCEPDVFCCRTRDVAERLADDRADVFKVVTLDRRDEFAIDEVVLTGFERILDPRLADVCRVHVVMLLSGIGSRVCGSSA